MRRRARWSGDSDGCRAWTSALTIASGVLSECAAAAKNWSRMRSRCSVSVMSCMTLTTQVAGAPTSMRTPDAIARITTSPPPDGCTTALYCSGPPSSNTRCETKSPGGTMPPLGNETRKRSENVAALMPMSSSRVQRSIFAAAGLAYSIVRS